MADAYVVELSRRADDDLRELSADVALRVARKLRDLGVDPRPRGDTIKRLRGIDTPTYRLRIGDYRAVFQVASPAVQVLRIVHRSRLERALEDLL